MLSRAPFGARLAAAMGERGPLCVGIDPHPALLDAWGLTDTPEGLRRFSLAVVESVADLAAAFKPQIALYERHGAAGLGVLEEVLAASGAAGVLSIADAKRGDIGSTMAAYADAWLGDGSPLAADAVTLSPYLGFESLRPALDAAAASGRGVFVLALTSNPEGASVQHTGGQHSVAKAICEAAATENARYAGEPLGSVGLVVGATVGDAVERLGLDLAAVRGPILAPGLGAQGATGAVLRSTFGAAYGRVLGTSSREILAGGPSRAGLRERTERTLAELA
ncbi:MAG: orotidine-5'-phosphate decarboxylase [Sinomonas sp.]|nr:orotidine-5'-phosphate decarboxylase [Sinomonas sp.]